MKKSSFSILLTTLFLMACWTPMAAHAASPAGVAAAPAGEVFTVYYFHGRFR